MEGKGSWLPVMLRAVAMSLGKVKIELVAPVEVRVGKASPD